MRKESSTQNGNPRGWRRKWRRVPPEHRRAAARELDTLFVPRRGSWVIAITLGASLLLHGVTAPFLLRGGAGASDRIEANEASYLARVMQKERARQISREVKNRITMPPPPPDPEAVVSETLTRELASDVEKVVGNLLEAHVTENLADYVKTNLKDELAQAAKHIADGELSEDEIQQLQEEMKRKAHELTVKALRKHRIKTQVKRAQISVTRWYEEDVSSNLMKNIYYETFLRPHKGAIWDHAYAGKYFGQMGPNYNWSQAKALEYLRKKRGDLDRVERGLPGRGYSKEPLATWPKPSLELAEALRKELRNLYTWDPSWRAIVRGGVDRRKSGTHLVYKHRTQGLLEEFYPHREAEMRRAAEQVTELWKQALAAADTYVTAAEDERPAAELKKAQDGLLAAIRELRAGMGTLHRVDERAYRLANSVARVRVLRGPERERVYKRLVDTLVDGLGPLIQDFAIEQFRDGIIKWDKSAEEAMEEFPKMVLPLLRRDVMRLFPKKRFDKLIFHGDYPDRGYKSPVTGRRRSWPSEADVTAGEKEFAALAAKVPGLTAYAEKRYDILAKHFEAGIDRVAEEILSRVLSEGLMYRDLSAFVEGVDYADKVQEKLDARKRALEGRGQDLAKLTKDGVPDTSASQFALLWGGSKGHGASLVPVQTAMRPGYFSGTAPESVVRGSEPRFPPAPASWGLERQVETDEVRPEFDPPSPRFEAVPFLARFPALDGRVGDLAKLRPLVLRGGSDPILLYAAWNYQGFFFCYHVKQTAERFYYPVPTHVVFSGHGDKIQHRKARGIGWAFRGDYCRLMFDTLDARNRNRGEVHTQEFLIFPRGTDTNGYVPGVERVIASQRDGITKEYRGVKSSVKTFPPQPMEGEPPDGSGPYRVTRFAPDGYTVEIFLPRSLFSVPVFAPGWYIGFDVAVAHGAQPRGRLHGQRWVENEADHPNRWGDVLMLGTDPRVRVRVAAPGYPVATSLTPGHSYLLTVVDPDRNVYLGAPDTVLVSAEVRGSGNDVEVFVLTETGDNTGAFRGFIDTQPGRGRRMRGALELMAGDEVRLGYVDTANSRGRRNVIYEVKLPVVAPVTDLARKR
jgi:hypothetical protein